MLTPGKRVAPMEVIQLNEECGKDYGEREDSKYQGQDGPTASKANDDPNVGQ